MSVNAGTPDLNVASSFRPRTNGHQSLLAHQYPWAPDPRLPARVMAVQHSATVGFDKSSAGGTTCGTFGPNQHHHLDHPGNPLADANAMFDEFLQYPDEVYATTKHSVSYPIFQQAMPVAFSFRPTENSEQTFRVNVSTSAPEAAMPLKPESNTALPVPTVLSEEVDTSKYEAISIDEWLAAPTEYEVSSPSSDDTAGSSPFVAGSENSDSFVDYYLRKRSMQDKQDFVFPVSYGSYSSTASLPYNFSGGQGASVTPFEGTQSTTETSPWSGAVFGYKGIAPTVHLGNSYGKHNALSVSPQEVQRPLSSQSCTSVSTASIPLSQSPGNDAKGKRMQRDELLMDLRRKGLSYREIKQRGRFREAESTLRGRVRVLTKDKRERVRKPEWQAQDVWSQSRCLKCSGV